MLSKVHDAINEPAIPLDLPYPSSFHLISCGTTIAGATEDTAKPRLYAISIGMLNKPSPINAIVVASNIKGINVISKTIKPFPVKLTFIPPLTRRMARQQVLIHCAHALLYGSTTSPKKFLTTQPMIIIIMIGGI